MNGILQAWRLLSGPTESGDSAERPDVLLWDTTASGGTNVIGNISSTSGYYSAPYSVIGGGALNCIDSGPVTSPGTASCYGVIGGGFGNIICAGTCYSTISGGYGNTNFGNYSSIVGGLSNANSGLYSAILGGSGNTISAVYTHAAIFGEGITSTINHALHLENIWLQPGAYCSAPYPGFGLIPGTVYVDTAATGCNALRMAV